MKPASTTTVAAKLGLLPRQHRQSIVRAHRVAAFRKAFTRPAVGSKSGRTNR